MSETAEQVYKESLALSTVTNPGHSPESSLPRDTTRTQSEIRRDISTMLDIRHRYDQAVLAETGSPWPTDGNEWTWLAYRYSHYCQELFAAQKKGNPA